MMTLVIPPPTQDFKPDATWIAKLKVVRLFPLAPEWFVRRTTNQGRRLVSIVQVCFKMHGSYALGAATGVMSQQLQVTKFCSLKGPNTNHELQHSLTSSHYEFVWSKYFSLWLLWIPNWRISVFRNWVRRWKMWRFLGFYKHYVCQRKMHGNMQLLSKRPLQSRRKHVWYFNTGPIWRRQWVAYTVYIKKSIWLGK